MGEIAVLRPNHPHNLLHTPMKSRRRSNFNPDPTNPLSKTPNFTLPDNRRQPPPKRIPNKKNTKADATKPPAVNNLVVGQVKILKRGETLEESLRISKKGEKDNKSSNPKIEDTSVSSTRRLGPDPEIMSKQTKKLTECFAGFVFLDSPPPSSVPLPCFSRKISVASDACSKL